MRHISYINSILIHPAAYIKLILVTLDHALKIPTTTSIGHNIRIYKQSSLTFKEFPQKLISYGGLSLNLTIPMKVLKDSLLKQICMNL